MCVCVYIYRERESKVWVGVGKVKRRASIPGRKNTVSKGTKVGMSGACLGDRKEARLCWVAVDNTISQLRGSEQEGYLKSGREFLQRVSGKLGIRQN